MAQLINTELDSILALIEKVDPFLAVSDDGFESMKGVGPDKDQVVAAWHLGTVLATRNGLWNWIDDFYSRVPVIVDGPFLDDAFEGAVLPEWLNPDNIMDRSSSD